MRETTRETPNNIISTHSTSHQNINGKHTTQHGKHTTQHGKHTTQPILQTLLAINLPNIDVKSQKGQRRLPYLKNQFTNPVNTPLHSLLFFKPTNQRSIQTQPTNNQPINPVPQKHKQSTKKLRR
jgi:hypothetical protein